MDNFFDNIPDASQAEVFQTLIATPGLKIERIVSKGQCSPANYWYDQARDEWIMLLRGSARIEFQDKPALWLKPGDHLLIPAHEKHRVAWTQPDVETLWIAVHYLAESPNKPT